MPETTGINRWHINCLFGTQYSGDIALLNLMILGSARSGTTSLGYYLMEHPEIYHIRNDDFESLGGHDINFPYNDPFTCHRTEQKTTELYRSATPETKRGKTDQTKIKYILNRAVYSIYHPHILFNLSEQLPDFKAILCLRNPIDTLFSTYCALSTGTGVRGAINMPAEDRLKQSFEQWLLADYDLDKDPSRIDIRHFSARLMRGVYYPGLHMLHKIVPKENIHVIPFEKHKNQTAENMKDVCRYLEIDENYQFERLSIKRGETVKPVPMKLETREWLARLFAVQNQQLFDLLGWSDHRWA